MKLKCQSNIVYAFGIFKHFHYFCTFSLCIFKAWEENTENVDHHPACTYQEHLHKDWSERYITETVLRLKFHQNQEAFLENFTSFYRSSLAVGCSLHWITIVPLWDVGASSPSFLWQRYTAHETRFLAVRRFYFATPLHPFNTFFIFLLPSLLFLCLKQSTVDDY